MFGWLKKRILKSLIDDAIKKLPELRDLAKIYIDEHKEEFIEKIKQAIFDLIQKEITKVFKK